MQCKIPTYKAAYMQLHRFKAAFTIFQLSQFYKKITTDINYSIYAIMCSIYTTINTARNDKQGNALPKVEVSQIWVSVEL